MSSGKFKSSFDMEQGGGEVKGAAITNGANGTNGHSAAALGRVELSMTSNLYGITPVELGRVLEEKDMQALSNLGNAEGLAKLLASDLHRGLDPAATGAASITSHRDTFGANVLPETPPKSFFRLAWENLHDPIIILLMFAALVSTVLGAAIPEERAKNGWIEGVAIWIAVLVVVSVGAGNDWQKDRQFRKLNAEKDKIQIKVIRGGQQILVEHTAIVVGDLLLLDTGDKVIADGVLVSSQGLVLDEASLTGESDPVKKNHDDDPWIRSGTQVSEGSGHVLVCAVGVNSMWGKTMALMQDAGDDQTPLQQKLEVVAMAIGKVGFAVAICCFIALLIKWCVENGGFPISKINNNGPVQFFLYSITIVVVAVPEGLPLAVTISLAYSMKKMMKDNNFVRVLAACETMGGATAICSDKTGTLTENRMTVVEGWFENKQWTQPPTPAQLASGNLQAIEANIALNSKAFLIEDKATGKVDFVGNRTECALLMLLKSWGLNYQDIRDENESRITKLYGFTSAKKMAGVLVKLADKYRLYNKGAAEWVLKECTQYVGEGGKVLPLTEAKRDELLEVVTGMAKRGLRCICMSYTDLPLEDPNRSSDHFEEMENVTKDLIVQCIVGIKDPVRLEVPAAVATCKRAGIVVRMVTGDNIHTARHIARECGILFDDGIAMEGPDFRVLEKEELQETLPKLQVLARSSPEDKLVLVRSLKELGEVVAVTGDGTNDAPALKESDVGLAMGIAGTEVAKEAADIVILDDNFSSIVKSVLWGRSVFNNIRKFLQFQLTVNFVALVTAFVGAIVGGHEPLNVLQLLWVNMIMDTMGALALATEPPSMSLLDQKPNGRTEPLINKKMWKHILVQGFYQLGWLFCCLYGLPVWFPYYAIDSKSEWLAESCYQDINDHYGQYMEGAGGSAALNANVTAQYGTDIISFNCNLIAECGWMVGEKNDPQCLLSTSPPWANHTGGVPSAWNEAICGVPNVNCLLYEVMDKGYDYVDSQWEDALDDEYKPALSILFNAFIMCQLANEVNARRINDEYNVFEGFFQSPIFITVIVLTLGFQAIIMELLGTFFKVNGLTWWEWLICFGAGLGAFPVSFITRFITRNTKCLP